MAFTVCTAFASFPVIVMQGFFRSLLDALGVLCSAASLSLPPSLHQPFNCNDIP